jgi:hypothetical protein
MGVEKDAREGEEERLLGGRVGRIKGEDVLR